MRRRQPVRDRAAREAPGRDPSVQAVQRGVSRREVLGFALGAGSVALATTVRSGRGDHPTTVTNLADATDTLDAGPIEPILATTSAGAPWYPPDPARRLAVVSFDASHPDLAARYLDTAGDADYATAQGNAFIALILRDPHLGCRNEFCASSGWWENPCHGETYNLLGERQGGPSPRGLDRYPTRVEDGRLLIGLARTVVGPAPGTGALEQPAAGPHCIGPS